MYYVSKLCPKAAIQAQTGAQTSDPPIKPLNPSRPVALPPEGPWESPPLLAKNGRGRRSSTILFNPFMNVLVLSRGDIEKIFQAVPKHRAKKRGPWEVF